MYVTHYVSTGGEEGRRSKHLGRKDFVRCHVVTGVFHEGHAELGATFQRVKALIQRVCQAEVHVEDVAIAAIADGLVVFLGIERGDHERDVTLLAKKIAMLRVFPGRTPMDKSVRDIDGACLVVSQFTLAADLSRGNRPSFGHAEDPARAEELYQAFCSVLRGHDMDVQTGQFGASMKVHLINDGPMTLWLDVREGRLQ